ncbi:stalk domain-containing protein [Paenibacillus sp.]|uniref:stalk domain-containing protein n=1 Tax=Paenibacillus sp. TaxID=58172 RepID=UPI002D5A8A7E|nr:stalk domain-containing protein [Paenibacillus sp.]HZG87289.1 stalk domain-containing protein [Paenibacillus sp.]
MKKKMLLAFSFLVVAVVSLSVGVYAASDIKLVVNGKTANAEIQIINGASYVPLRAAAELLGAEVNFDNATRTITITSKAGTQTGSSPTPVTTGAKSFNVNVTMESGPMKMKISKVTLDSAFKSSPYLDPINAVILDVEVENTSTDTISWHPNQGTLVLNTKEQAEAAMSLFHSDDVGGEFVGKVVKKGKIVVEVKSDVSEITSLSFRVSGPFNAESFETIGAEQTVDIVLQ